VAFRLFFFFKQKTAYEMLPRLEFRRVLFRSRPKPRAKRPGRRLFTGLERPRWPKVHSAVALRAFRIWLSVAPSGQCERELQRSYSFARSGLLSGGPGGWRRLRCRRLE